MEIIYQGVDITNSVQVRKCIVKDMANNRCDTIEIEFEEAGKWYQWSPERDDKIIVKQDGYDSGIMYAHAITPENGKYKIIAASLPCGARNKISRSFINKTLGEILQECARASGMDYQVFGVSERIEIPYAEQDNETEASFLHKLLTREGCAFKCVNGKYTAISIPWAQDRAAVQKMRVFSNDKFATYFRSGMQLKSLTVKGPYGNATARDTRVPDNNLYQIMNLPVLNDMQAGRWARGTLLDFNRNCEHVIMKTKYNPEMTAMIRVDLEGDTDMTGEWILEEVIHDLTNKATSVKMRRCIYTIE